MPNAAAFFQAWAPYAQQVHAATGVDTGVLLALAAEETGYGTSALAAQYNVWSVKWTPEAPAGTTDQPGGFCGYPSPEAAVEDMIRVLSLPEYAAVRQAQGVQAQVAALVDSPYDGGTLAQRRTWGHTILAVYAEQGLSQYDGPAGTAAPPGRVTTGPGMVTISDLPTMESTGPAVLALALGALLVALIASA